MIEGAARRVYSLANSHSRNAEKEAQTGNKRAPIQLAQCWFHGLVISNAKL